MYSLHSILERYKTFIKSKIFFIKYTNYLFKVLNINAINININLHFTLLQQNDKIFLIIQLIF